MVTQAQATNQRFQPLHDQSGQAITEYVLLLSIMLGIYLAFIQGIEKTGLANRLMRPIQRDYAMAYKYGHPDAKGFDEGGPEHHPRVVSGQTNFRLFLNPSKR